MFSIYINNYRCFKEAEFHFSKINILIGENSSGKSSLFKLLLALKQTLISPINREINLALTGELADLGTYKETIYYHQDELPLTIKFGFDLTYYPFFLDVFSNESELEEINKDDENRIKGYVNYPKKASTYLSYIFTKALDVHESIDTEIYNESIGSLNIIHKKPVQDIKDKLLGTYCTIRFFDFETQSMIELNDIQYQKDGFLSIILGPSLFGKVSEYFQDSSENSTIRVTDFKSSSEEVNKIFHKIAFLLVSQNFLKFKLEKLQYINPIKTQPNRVYLYKDAKNSNNINDIEDVVEFFSRTGDANKLAFEEFAEIIEKFGIAEKIEIIKDSRLPVTELRVKVKDLLSNITDVGYGVSLQLPIILSALLSERLSRKKGSVLLIEQPEVHLHPRLHAELIETLFSLSTHTTYFIETHSEHIIRKLQVLLKEKKYGKTLKDVTINYLKRVDKSTEITCHKIDETGYLQPMFPTGFFDNSYLLAKELLD